MTATSRRDGRQAAATPEVRLAVPEPKRQVKTPLLLLAILLAVLFALAAVWFYSVSTARTPIVIMANDLARGSTVAETDLVVTYIGTDDPIVATPADQIQTLVGQRALVDLFAGDIIHTGLVATAVEIPPAERVVGVRLEPGWYPPSLVVGDLVDVVLATGDVPTTVAGVVVDIRTGEATDGSVVFAVQVPADSVGLVGEASLDRKVVLAQRSAP